MRRAARCGAVATCPPPSGGAPVRGAAPQPGRPCPPPCFCRGRAAHSTNTGRTVAGAAAPDCAVHVFDSFADRVLPPVHRAEAKRKRTEQTTQGALPAAAPIVCPPILPAPAGDAVLQVALKPRQIRRLVTQLWPDVRLVPPALDPVVRWVQVQPAEAPLCSLRIGTMK